MTMTNNAAQQTAIKTINRKGFSLMELLVLVAVISIVASIGIPCFDSCLKYLEVSNALRTITAELNTARYQALKMNRPVQFYLKVNENNKVILLRIKKGKTWVEFQRCPLEEKLSVSSNNSPVFYPAGSVSPLCSIHVINEVHHYKITISIAGRVKITEIKS